MFVYRNKKSGLYLKHNDEDMELCNSSYYLTSLTCLSGINYITNKLNLCI